MKAPDHHDESWDERLVHSAQGYVSRAWRVSQRETLHQARRYSAFVRFMKRALPLAAAGLTLAVIAFALVPRRPGNVAVTFERLGTVENDRAMLNPRLTGTSDDGLPFVVRAESAVQESPAAPMVRLNKVTAEMTLKDGAMLHLSAAQGRVNTRTRALDLTGGIRFSASDGYSAQTATASADLNTGMVKGTSPVRAESKFGTLTANGFAFDKQTRRLRFDGDVHMLLYGSPQ